MTEQTSLWQSEQQSSTFAELCNGLYERELQLLANAEFSSPIAIQGRLKSLSHYIKRTAHLMTQVDTPLALDSQNASWSAKQMTTMPIAGQDIESVNQWYNNITISHGLVVPIALSNRIILDCVDSIDFEKQRFRTNVYGWFNMQTTAENQPHSYHLLKPNKKVMMAACTGHCWQNKCKARPIIPNLRELLLSCAINWRNFKQPLSI